MKGKQPCWMSKRIQLYIKPVAATLRIPLKSWHTLRHSYTTLLRQNGNNPKVVQDLWWHASYGITMNVYDSAVSDEKREAYSGVMRLLATVLKAVPRLRMVEWQLLDSSVVPVV